MKLVSHLLQQFEMKLINSVQIGIFRNMLTFADKAGQLFVGTHDVVKHDDKTICYIGRVQLCITIRVTQQWHRNKF